VADVDSEVQEDCEGDHKKEENRCLPWILFPVCHGVHKVIAVATGRKNNENRWNEFVDSNLLVQTTGKLVNDGEDCIKHFKNHRKD
jgi:hypothetical protein